MLLWVSVKLLILPWLEPRTTISPKAILLKQSSLLIHLSAYILFSFSVVVVVVVVIFFTNFFFSSTLIRFVYAQFFFWQTIAKILHTNRIFFSPFFLRPITLIFASNFNLSTICQNNLAQDHPPWIFFFSLSSSHSHFLSLNLHMVPIQRAVPRVTPICSTKFPQLFKSN